MASDFRVAKNVKIATGLVTASAIRLKRASTLPDFSSLAMPAGGVKLPLASSNPYLDTMYTPTIGDYGFGVGILQHPFVGTGNVNFPTGNRMKPMDSVLGTFAFAKPWNVRFGTEGGPFFPMQNKNFYKTAEAISEINAMNNAAEAPAVGAIPKIPASALQDSGPFPAGGAALPPLPPGFG
uniref:Uncharacterized protein n=1 Tax=Romanomermis culicivorax TaxID=13658 RepID=A0A915L800_ROMCU